MLNSSLLHVANSQNTKAKKTSAVWNGHIWEGSVVIGLRCLFTHAVSLVAMTDWSVIPHTQAYIDYLYNTSQNMLLRKINMCANRFQSWSMNVYPMHTLIDIFMFDHVKIYVSSHDITSIITVYIYITYHHYKTQWKGYHYKYTHCETQWKVTMI